MKSLLLCLAPVLQAPADDPTPRRTAEEARADLALPRHALSDIHPGYGRYESADETGRAFDALDARLAQGASLGQLYL